MTATTSIRRWTRVAVLALMTITTGGAAIAAGPAAYALESGSR